MNNWKQRRVELVDLFAKRMEIEYDIKEMTTDRQQKNGTRQFVLPNGDQTNLHSRILQAKLRNEKLNTI